MSANCAGYIFKLFTALTIFGFVFVCCQFPDGSYRVSNIADGFDPCSVCAKYPEHYVCRVDCLGLPPNDDEKSTTAVTEGFNPCHDVCDEHFDSEACHQCVSGSPRANVVVDGFDPCHDVCSGESFDYEACKACVENPPNVSGVKSNVKPEIVEGFDPCQRICENRSNLVCTTDGFCLGSACAECNNATIAHHGGCGGCAGEQGPLIPMPMDWSKCPNACGATGSWNQRPVCTNTGTSWGKECAKCMGVKILHDGMCCNGD